MKRHIDADYTIKALSIFGDKKNGNQHFLNGIETAKEVINNQPTADVVEVVRCKECRYKHPEGFCKSSLGLNGYCSKGERADE